MRYSFKRGAISSKVSGGDLVKMDEGGQGSSVGVAAISSKVSGSVEVGGDLVNGGDRNGGGNLVKTRGVSNLVKTRGVA
jgi:hypothetical protein